jgi:large subunit ribosomal protein L16
MFRPIKLKYKKEHKTSFKNKEYSSSKSSLIYGNYGLMAGCKGLLLHTELEAAKKLIAKAVKGIGLVFLRVRPNRPRTKKKRGMRMGKGKAGVERWVAEVSAGMIILEVCGSVAEKKIKLALKSSGLRLSVKTRSIFFSDFEKDI